MEKKRKIALVTYSLSNGGLERVVANSSFLFSELGFEVYLFVLNSKINYPYKGKLIKSNLDKVGSIGKIQTYYKFYKKIKNERFDLIIDHRYRLNLLTEVIWNHFFYKNEKVLNYIHNYKISNYLSKQKLFNKILYSKSKLICVSKGIEEEINRNYPFLTTQTIYNSIHIETDSLDTLSEKYIISISRMDKNNVKQVDMLLKCYAKSNLPALNVKLIILGDGIRLNEMKLTAKQLKVDHLIYFKGFVSNPYSYLKDAFFTVLTSKNEGLPTVLIESLALATPVISFDCPTGPKEIIRNNYNGLLIENQNTDEMIKGMNLLVSDVELYNEIKKNALQSVQKFSKEKISLEWQKLINDKL